MPHKRNNKCKNALFYIQKQLQKTFSTKFQNCKIFTCIIKENTSTGSWHKNYMLIIKITHCFFIQAQETKQKKLSK